jgi:hypothetical protein
MLSSATDGVITRWEPNYSNYWSGFLFATSFAAPGVGYLEITISSNTIRTILLSVREWCHASSQPWSSIGIKISVGDIFATST